MCKVQYYDVVYPDGLIERKRRIVPCRRGTPSSPCQNLEYDDDAFEERQATEEETRAKLEPYRQVLTPRAGSSGQPEIMSNRSKPKGILRKLFGSKDKAKSQTRLPGQGTSTEPKSDERRKGTADHRNVRRRPYAVKLHNPGEGKERPLSSSNFETKPPQTSPSPLRDPELDRARWRDEERQKRRTKQEHLDQVVQAQEEAQARAGKLHSDEEDAKQKRQQDLAWGRSEGKIRKNGRPASYHAIPDEQLTDEQLGAQQLQYERDLERIRAFDRLVAKEQEKEDHHTQPETKDRHARRQAEDQERMAWQRREDEDRRRRQREAGIPRRPRHPPVVSDIRNSQADDFDQQGSAFVESAIRNAERQEAERRAPSVSWSLPIRGRDGLMRRNTIDGSQEEERNGRRRKGHKRDRRSG